MQTTFAGVYHITQNMILYFYNIQNICQIPFSFPLWSVGFRKIDLVSHLGLKSQDGMVILAQMKAEMIKGNESGLDLTF